MATQGINTFSLLLLLLLSGCSENEYDPYVDDSKYVETEALRLTVEVRGFSSGDAKVGLNATAWLYSGDKPVYLNRRDQLILTLDGGEEHRFYSSDDFADGDTVYFLYPDLPRLDDQNDGKHIVRVALKRGYLQKDALQTFIEIELPELVLDVPENGRWYAFADPVDVMWQNSQPDREVTIKTDAFCSYHENEANAFTTLYRFEYTTRDTGYFQLPALSDIVDFADTGLPGYCQTQLNISRLYRGVTDPLLHEDSRIYYFHEKSLMFFMGTPPA